MERSRAQVSLEYMLIVGIIFVIMIPIFYYAARESTDQIRLNQAEDAVNTLARTADSLYALGPGSRDYVTVTMPSGVSGSSVNGSEITLRLDIFGARSDILAFSQAPLTGSLKTDQGTYWILVEVLDSGLVKIGEGNDTQPPQIVYTYPKGRITFNDIVLQVSTNEPAFCKYGEENTSYSSMGDNLVGSLMSHEDDLGVLEDGNYVFYSRCVDLSGNEMTSSAVINFTINTTITAYNQTGNGTNETYEQYPPVITLISPAGGYIDNDGIVMFSFNASDDSSIAFCELIMNDTSLQIINPISKTVPNNVTKGGLDYGGYYWSINCTDVHGNEGASAERAIMINYTQDHDIPAVRLSAPADNSVRNYWLVKFMYNVSDASSSISHCILHMHGTLDEGGDLSWNVVDDNVAEQSTETITLPLFRADYTWQISCADSSYNANTGYSETRKLRVNVSAGDEAFINSCAGWCGWSDMSGGVCENNIAKCGNDCGLPYSDSDDCYAGSSVSAQYCLGGAESKICCCIP